MLDVLDTAIKIGLGALIGGMSSYVLSAKQYKIELHKKRLEERKSLIKEASNNFEQSNHLTNNVSSEISLFATDGSMEIKELRKNCSQHVMDAQRIIESAKSTANLLDDEVLFNEFDRYYGTLYKIKSAIHLLNDIDSEFIENINKLFREAKGSRNEIYAIIAAAYKETSI